MVLFKTQKGNLTVQFMIEITEKVIPEWIQKPGTHQHWDFFTFEKFSNNFLIEKMILKLI